MYLDQYKDKSIIAWLSYNQLYHTTQNKICYVHPEFIVRDKNFTPIDPEDFPHHGSIEVKLQGTWTVDEVLKRTGGSLVKIRINNDPNYNEGNSNVYNLKFHPDYGAKRSDIWVEAFSGGSYYQIIEVLDSIESIQQANGEIPLPDNQIYMSNLMLRYGNKLYGPFDCEVKTNSVVLTGLKQFDYAVGAYNAPSFQKDCMNIKDERGNIALTIIHRGSFLTPDKCSERYDWINNQTLLNGFMERLRLKNAYTKDQVNQFKEIAVQFLQDADAISLSKERCERLKTLFSGQKLNALCAPEIIDFALQNEYCKPIILTEIATNYLDKIEKGLLEFKSIREQKEKLEQDLNSLRNLRDSLIETIGDLEQQADSLKNSNKQLTNQLNINQEKLDEAQQQSNAAQSNQATEGDANSDQYQSLMAELGEIFLNFLFCCPNDDATAFDASNNNNKAKGHNKDNKFKLFASRTELGLKTNKFVESTLEFLCKNYQTLGINECSEKDLSHSLLYVCNVFMNTSALAINIVPPEQVGKVIHSSLLLLHTALLIVKPEQQSSDQHAADQQSSEQNYNDALAQYFQLLESSQLLTATDNVATMCNVTLNGAAAKNTLQFKESLEKLASEQGKTSLSPDYIPAGVTENKTPIFKVEAETFKLACALKNLTSSFDQNSNKQTEDKYNPARIASHHFDQNNELSISPWIKPFLSYLSSVFELVANDPYNILVEVTSSFIPRSVPNILPSAEPISSDPEGAAKSLAIYAQGMGAKSMANMSDMARPGFRCPPKNKHKKRNKNRKHELTQIADAIFDHSAQTAFDSFELNNDFSGNNSQGLNVLLPNAYADKQNESQDNDAQNIASQASSSQDAESLESEDLLSKQQLTKSLNKDDILPLELSIAEATENDVQALNTQAESSSNDQATNANSEQNADTSKASVTQTSEQGAKDAQSEANSTQSEAQSASETQATTDAQATANTQDSAQASEQQNENEEEIERTFNGEPLLLKMPDRKPNQNEVSSFYEQLIKLALENIRQNPEIVKGIELVSLAATLIQLVAFKMCQHKLMPVASQLKTNTPVLGLLGDYSSENYMALHQELSMAKTQLVHKEKEVASLRNQLNKAHEQLEHNKQMQQTAQENKQALIDGAQMKGQLQELQEQLQQAKSSYEHIQQQAREQKALYEQMLKETKQKQQEYDILNQQCEATIAEFSSQARQTARILDNKLLEKVLQNMDESEPMHKVIFDQSLLQPQLDSKTIIEQVSDYFEKAHRHCTHNDIANYLICLTQGFITTFAGEPGTGKTSLCTLLAHALGMAREDQQNRFVEVAVERGWTSSKDFTGYYNPLTRTIEKSNEEVFNAFVNLDGECLRSLDDDVANKRYAPFLILLDEANLSPIEHYWAAFLKNCELNMPNRQLSLGNKCCFNLPEHLRFMATVNFDHTTEELSPRFLDRSWIIMLSPHQFNAEEMDVPPVPQEKMISFNSLKQAFSPTSSDTIDENVANKWEALQNIFKSDEVNMPIMPRSLKMVHNYCAVACRCMEKDSQSTRLAPLDYAFSQKILPLISGTGPNYQKLIDMLLDECSEQNMPLSFSHLKRIKRSAVQTMGYYQFFTR